MKEAKMVQWINLLVNVILSAVLGVTGQFVTNSFSLVNFLQTYLLTLCVGFTLSTWLPVNAWGQNQLVQGCQRSHREAARRMEGPLCGRQGRLGCRP